MSPTSKKPSASKKTAGSKKSSKKSAKKLSSKGLMKRLAGTWNLVSAEDIDPSTGKWVPYTFGNPPCGYFVYDATGHASIQIMTTPPVQLQQPDTPTPAEALQIFNNYIAYFGTYTVDAQNITVNVAGAWDPSQVGTAQARPYQLKGDTLIIGDQKTYKRTLKRFK
jgi:Lipocalin-like domain